MRTLLEHHVKPSGSFIFPGCGSHILPFTLHLSPFSAVLRHICAQLPTLADCFYLFVPALTTSELGTIQVQLAMTLRCTGLPVSVVSFERAGAWHQNAQEH